MTAIRRIYAYLLAFAGLAMLAVAAANLTQVLIDVALQSPLTRADTYVRDTVSRYAAVALVGLPVWLVHWWWIERWVRDPDERASTLRGLYLYVVLALSMLVVAFSLRESLSAAFSGLLGGAAAQSGMSAAWLRPVAFTVPGALVWVFHLRVAARDLAIAGESRGWATLRRWYVYGLALVGLVLLLSNTQALLERLWVVLVAPGAAASLIDSVAWPAAGALVGLSVWLAHWVILPARLPSSSRDGDGVATLRSVYLFLGLTIGVAGTLFGLSQMLYYAVGRALGVERPGGIGGDLLQALASPASVAIVYGVAWAYQRHALRRPALVFEEAPRQAGVRRLYSYLVSLVALLALAAGVAGLLWSVGDLLVNAGSVTSGTAWREQVALYSTLALVGLPVWLLHWRPVPASDADTRSLARRLYLYLSLIGAMLTLLGSLAMALYRVISIALGASSSVDVLADLTHAAALVIIASAVAAYHWRILRADAHRVPTAASPLSVASSVAPTTAVVEIRAPDAAALERALSTLRATGVEVTVR